MSQDPTYQYVQKFLIDLKRLSTIDVSKIKGKQIILIVGPTGAGKSTFLNMMANSIFTCKKNIEDDWEIEANPSVAKIGHKLSETFLPNYWQDVKSKVVYCDCAGFHDSNGYLHDIAKSYFLKQIGNSAQSFKIVTVADIHILKGERAVSFKNSVMEINRLVEKFKFERDCIFVVNKTLHTTQPSNIAAILKNKLQLQFSPERIFVVREPDENGVFTPLDNSLINKAPSIKEHCHLPLSQENRLKISQYIAVIQKELSGKLILLKKLFQFGILNFYQQNLNASQQQITNFETQLTNCRKQFKANSSSREFNDKVVRICQKLDSKNCKKLSEKLKNIAQDITNIIQNLMFLKELTQKDVSSLKPASAMDLPEIINKKRGKNTQLQDYNTLNSYLSKQNISINDLKNTVHKKLIASPPTLPVTCSGAVKYQGSTTYAGSADYEGSKGYSGQVKCHVEKLCSGSVSYDQYVSYSGSTTTPNCSHDRGLFNISCLLCSHNTKTISFSGSKNFYGSISYSQKVSQNCQKDYSGYVTYSGKAPYNGTVNYEGSVQYNKSQNVSCKDNHHACSCANLSQLCLNAIQAIKDIQYFKQILNDQSKQLTKFNLPSKSVTCKSDGMTSSVKKFSNFSREQIQKQIHSELIKAKGKFNHLYKGDVQYTGQKSYSGSCKYDGTKAYNDTVKCTGVIPVKGSVSKTIDQSVSHSVKLYSCYEDCWACNGNGSSWHSDVPVKINKTIYKDYADFAEYSVDQPYNGTISYSGSAPYSGSVKYSGVKSYQGSKQVICEQNHHTCTSCDKWVETVNIMKALFEDKANLLQEIQKNSTVIQNAYLNLTV